VGSSRDLTEFAALDASVHDLRQPRGRERVLFASHDQRRDVDFLKVLQRVVIARVLQQCDEQANVHAGDVGQVGAEVAAADELAVDVGARRHLIRELGVQRRAPHSLSDLREPKDQPGDRREDGLQHGVVVERVEWTAVRAADGDQPEHAVGVQPLKLEDDLNAEGVPEQDRALDSMGVQDGQQVVTQVADTHARPVLGGLGVAVGTIVPPHDAMLRRQISNDVLPDVPVTPQPVAADQRRRPVAQRVVVNPRAVRAVGEAVRGERDLREWGDVRGRGEQLRHPGSSRSTKKRAITRPWIYHTRRLEQDKRHEWAEAVEETP
jgi:hypothetical protein